MFKIIIFVHVGHTGLNVNFCERVQTRNANIHLNYNYQKKLTHPDTDPVDLG